MALRIVCALLLAFLVVVVFGKYYIPWLKKKKASQPLKEEVARIYAEQAAEEAAEETERPRDGADTHV